MLLQEHKKDVLNGNSKGGGVTFSGLENNNTENKKEDADELY